MAGEGGGGSPVRLNPELAICCFFLLGEGVFHLLNNPLKPNTSLVAFQLLVITVVMRGSKNFFPGGGDLRDIYVSRRGV